MNLTFWIIILVAIIGICIEILICFWKRIEIEQSITLIISTLATFTAIFSASSAYNSFEQSKKSNEFQKYQSIKNQANKIAVWDADRKYHDEHKNRVIIQNDSTLPIYDVSVFIVRNNDKSKSIKDLKINKNEYSFAEVYPPNETSILLNGHADKGENHDSVAIVFKDATNKNKYWYRDVKGNIHGVSDNELKCFNKKTTPNYSKRSEKYPPHIIVENNK